MKQENNSIPNTEKDFVTSDSKTSEVPCVAPFDIGNSLEKCAIAYANSKIRKEKNPEEWWRTQHHFREGWAKASQSFREEGWTPPKEIEEHESIKGFELPPFVFQHLVDEANVRCEQWINQGTFNRFSIRTYLFHMAKWGFIQAHKNFKSYCESESICEQCGGEGWVYQLDGKVRKCKHC